MKRILCACLAFTLVLLPVQTASAKSPTYQKFYKLMSNLWKANQAPFSTQNIRKSGSRLMFCSDLRIAAENESGVRLSRSDRGDFIDACVDFLKSKGR
jgi:hypothetical protein